MKQEPDQLDRIRYFLLEGGKLNKKDNELFEKAMKIYPLICSGKSKIQIAKIVERTGWGKKNHAFKLIAQTKKIFLIEENTDESEKRQLYIEMIKRAYRKAELLDKPGAMVQAVQLMSRLDGILDQNESYTIIYQNLQLPELSITDDPKVIEIPAEEISFEE